MMKVIASIGYISSGVVSIGLFFGGVIGGYTRLLGPDISFKMFVGGMLLGVVPMIAGLVDLSRNGASAKSVVLVMGLVPFCALVYLLLQGRGYPMINDVTTDLVYPPEFVEAKAISANVDRDMDFPLEFKEEIEGAYSELIPKPKLSTVDDVYFEAKSIIEGISNWELTASRIGDKESFIEGTVTSGVFGFVDDFVIRIAAAGGGGCVVDMRSKSRLGKGDFGQNADHIRLFMGLLE